MPFDLQESGWPTDLARREFQRVRTTILENLDQACRRRSGPGVDDPGQVSENSRARAGAVCLLRR